MSTTRPGLRARVRRLAGTVAGALLLLGAPATTTAAHAATTPNLGQHIGVPAYIPTSDTTSWTEITGAGSGLGVAIANPASGPGSAVDSGWKSVIDSAHANGTKVIGYVDSGYFGFTGRQTADGKTDATAWLVQAEQQVNKWYSYYGDSVDGIFFDDGENVCGPTTDSTEYVDLYKQLNAFVHHTHPGSLTVVNPGVAVPECYEEAADVIVTFEGSEADYLNPSTALAPAQWQLDGDPDQFWNIVYNVSQSDLPTVIATSKQNNSGYFYATDRTLASNPYSAMPSSSYFSSELSGIAVTDTQTPVTPDAPDTTYVGGTTVSLSWPADDTGTAVAYDVYANGAKVGSVSNWSPDTQEFDVTGLTPATSYTFTVRSRDVAGTRSAASTGTTVTTAAANSTVPTTPGSFTATGVKAASLTLSWTASTSSDDLASYDVYANGSHLLTLSPSTTSVFLGSLEPGTTYAFTVKATDDSGAVSAAAGPLSVTTLTPADGVTSPSVSITSSTATFQAQYNLPYTFEHVFIDTDNNASTGYSLTSGSTTIGADYLIENGSLYAHSGDGWSWGIVSGVDPLVSSTDGLYVWQIPTSTLGLTTGNTVAAVFHGTGGYTEAYSSAVTATVG
ncbi:spherulation-specific family 4 protein [Streptomyces sp. NPDC047072]|uniref:spherulation-specific family 4 protein n=1 Tax=Streptomyces sp. NPDC047072 TaxID=3154809 RepID=UPI0033D0A044